MLRLQQQAKLAQQMRLAPRMIQSMEILQLPMMALEQRIEQELESNVALERVEPGDDPSAIAEERRDDELEERLAERPLVVQQDGSATAEDFARLGEMERRYADAFDADSAWARPAPRGGERDGKLDAMANAPARGESLVEQLRHQWSFTDQPPEIEAAGSVLIDYIDDDGRLGADLATIARQCDASRLPPGTAPTVELFERALHALQRALEPRGLAARDVHESLRLQAEAMIENAADAEDAEGWRDVLTLLERHYDDLLQNRLPRIARASGMEIARIEAAVERMGRLRLTPGRDIVDDEVPPVVPDVVVEYDADADRHVATLRDDRLPALRVSGRYERMSKDRAVDAPTRDWLATCVRNAHWLLDAIAQRRATLLRVVEIVLARQRDWFDHGPTHLRPLPMIEVADQLGIHVGTVSRAVADKWIQTPRGLVPLRRFFSGGTETSSGDDMSWEAVKAMVREIVEAEDPTRPLSDQAIADALAARGVTLARRTVVKYREQLGIQPARRRKRHG